MAGTCRRSDMLSSVLDNDFSFSLSPSFNSVARDSFFELLPRPGLLRNLSCSPFVKKESCPSCVGRVSISPLAVLLVDLLSLFLDLRSFECVAGIFTPGNSPSRGISRFPSEFTIYPFSTLHSFFWLFCLAMICGSYTIPVDRGVFSEVNMIRAFRPS